MKNTCFAWRALLLALVAFVPRPVAANAEDDRKAVAALDTEYQVAVKKNVVSTMDRILADDFVLVTGSGKKYTKAELLEEARSGQHVYERNDELEQTVRVWGDTAVVTAKLWVKGTRDGQPFEVTLWFSDTYVRARVGWRYVFGQARCHCRKLRDFHCDDGPSRTKEVTEMKKEWSRPGVLLVVLLLASTSSAINHTGLQTEEKPKLGCSSSEYYQFDFWIGDWDAFEKGGNDPVARLRVNRILDGCVLREDYQGQEGIKGESFAFSMHPGTFGIRPG